MRSLLWHGSRGAAPLSRPTGLPAAGLSLERSIAGAVPLLRRPVSSLYTCADTLTKPAGWPFPAKPLGWLGSPHSARDNASRTARLGGAGHIRGDAACLRLSRSYRPRPLLEARAAARWLASCSPAPLLAKGASTMARGDA